MIAKTILSYLYLQYQDDGDLQAFINAYNALTQDYVDWFNAVGLPIYTGAPISGNLLDWVAEGLYGIKRPSLVPTADFSDGPFNTWQFNTIPFNDIGATQESLVSDDIFKRIITWNFYKGDGNIFNIRWLKRRVMRFLFGVNGADYLINETYPISVVFNGYDIYINLIDSIIKYTNGTFYNNFEFNSLEFNSVDFIKIDIPDTPLPFIETFKQCIDSGVLHLPFQFNFHVSISF